MKHHLICTKVNNLLIYFHYTMYINTKQNQKIILKFMEIKLFAKRISILFLLILAITTNMIYAQNTDIISGRVSSSIGEPMIGASVMVKGTTNGTITDLDGNFKVEASSTATEKSKFDWCSWTC